MPITTSCPKCKALFRLPDALAGKQVRCQKCQETFGVPLAPSGLFVVVETPPPPPAPPPAPIAAPPPEPAPIARSPVAEVIIEAKLAEPAPAKPVIFEATLAEPSAAPKPAPVPVPTERPASARGALAALIGFFLAMLGVGSLSGYWVASHLSAPIVSMPITRVGIDPINERFIDDRKKDGRKPIEPTLLPTAADGKAFVPGRLETVKPWIDPGVYGQDGPFRLFRVPLKAGVRYHVVVNVNGFAPNGQQAAPRVRIYDRETVVVSKDEGLLARRVILPFQPNHDGDFLIHITSLNRQIADFDLSFAPVSTVGPIRIPLFGQPPSVFQHALRVEDPLDATAPPDFGPYREYAVALEANKWYEFKVTSPNYLPVLRFYDGPGFPRDQFAQRELREVKYLYRAPATRDYRLRVTSEVRGMGDYTLQVKEVVKAAGFKVPQIILATFDAQETYEDTRSLTAQDPTQPGLGMYKQYLVPLVKGERYRIDMTSVDFATDIVIFNPAGLRMAAGVPIYDGNNAQRTFQATETGTYRIHACARRLKEKGAYTLRITTNP